MTARKRRPVVTITIGRWTTEILGPARVTVGAVRSAVGDSWSFDARSRILRVQVDRTADVIAALEQAGANVQVRGVVPQPGLWAG